MLLKIGFFSGVKTTCSKGVEKSEASWSQVKTQISFAIEKSEVKTILIFLAYRLICVFA